MNEVAWAFYISGLALVIGYGVSLPGLLVLRRRGLALGGYAMSLTAAALLWWGAFLGGFGRQSVYNIIELFPLSAVFAVAVYAALAWAMIRPPRRPVLGLFVSSWCLVALVCLRAFMPEIGE